MSSSRVLTIFGLNETQHSMRKMHQILVHYHLLPGPGLLDRATLWSALLVLVRTLDEDEVESLRSWYENGGDLPSTRHSWPPVANLALDSRGQSIQSAQGIGEGGSEVNNVRDENGSDDDVVFYDQINARSGWAVLGVGRTRQGMDGDDDQIERDGGDKSDSENADEIQIYLSNMRDIWDEESTDGSRELIDDDGNDWYKTMVSKQMTKQGRVNIKEADDEE
jgi:hypothetical protein